MFKVECLKWKVESLKWKVACNLDDIRSKHKLSVFRFQLNNMVSKAAFCRGFRGFYVRYCDNRDFPLF